MVLPTVQQNALLGGADPPTTPIVGAVACAAAAEQIAILPPTPEAPTIVSIVSPPEVHTVTKAVRDIPAPIGTPPPTPSPLLRQINHKG